MNEKEIRFEPSTIRNIDQAMMNFVNELNIRAMTNKGWKEVPVIWTGAERVYQVKKDKKLRDENGVLILPQMTVHRDKLSKKMDKKGIYWGDKPPVNDAKGGTVELTRRINQEKTGAFKKADNGKIKFQTAKKKKDKTVWEIVTIPIPVYLDLNYKLMVRAEYQNQMNDILQPILTKTGGLNYFLIESGPYRYEAFLQEDYGLDNNINNFDEEERVFKTEININVLGYIIGGDKNEERPKRAIRENAVDVKLSEEVIITGSIEDYLKGK